MNNTELVIIGSGPAGLTAAIYAARAGLRPIVAAGKLPGGQLIITTEVENFPGFPTPIAGPDLIQRMFDQAKYFGAIILEEEAFEFKLNTRGPHKLKIGLNTFETKAIIFATGAAAKWLHNPNEQKYINNGISACATCDGPLPRFRNKHVYVVGGGDTACEEALFLARFTNKVFLVHRREQLRASKIMQSRVKTHDKIEIIWSTIIIGYSGEETLEGLILQNVFSKETRHVECAGLFVAIGHSPMTSGLEKCGLDLSTDGYINVKSGVFTNIAGVFAAGDNHDTQFKQAITAAGFGCMAAITAERWLTAQNTKK